MYQRSLVSHNDETISQDDNFALARNRLYDKKITRPEGGLGQVDRVPREGKLPYLARKMRFIKERNMRHWLSHWVARLAEAPSLNVNRP